MADHLEVEAKERRIVVAIDEGEESLYALRWCLLNVIPAHAHNTIILLYARPPAPPVYSVWDGAGYLVSGEAISSMELYSKDLPKMVLAKAENICKGYPNIKVEAKACSGDARDVICEMVEKLGADILVMGSHGYGFIQRALIGSVSDYCARNAKCPVLIVKRPSNSMMN